MVYARDNRHVLRGCVLVLSATALLLLVPYVVLTRGFSVPIQCVWGQQTAPRATFNVDIPDADADAFERALKGVADRRGMVFASMPLPTFPSGRRQVSYDICGSEAHLVAVRHEDADTYSIIISQAVSAPPGAANLLIEDVRKWVSERQAP